MLSPDQTDFVRRALVDHHIGMGLAGDDDLHTRMWHFVVTLAEFAKAEGLEVESLFKDAMWFAESQGPSLNGAANFYGNIAAAKGPRFDTETKEFHVPNAERFAYLAALVAIEAPARANVSAFSARIPWRLISDLRVELEAIGFDWREAVNHREKLERERA